MFAFENFFEALDRFRHRHLFAFATGKDLRDGKGLAEETLDFARAVERAMGAGTAIMAYEEERRRSLHEALAGAQHTVSIFIGPEGGYTAEEAVAATTAGAQLVTLGPRVLRTETASPLLAALVFVGKDVAGSRRPGQEANGKHDPCTRDGSQTLLRPPDTKHRPTRQNPARQMSG